MSCTHKNGPNNPCQDGSPEALLVEPPFPTGRAPQYKCGQQVRPDRIRQEDDSAKGEVFSVTLRGDALCVMGSVSLQALMVAGCRAEELPAKTYPNQRR